MKKITLGQSVKIRNMVAAGSTPEEVAAQFGLPVERVKSFCPKVKTKKTREKLEKKAEELS